MKEKPLMYSKIPDKDSLVEVGLLALRKASFEGLYLCGRRTRVFSSPYPGAVLVKFSWLVNRHRRGSQH